MVDVQVLVEHICLSHDVVYPYMHRCFKTEFYIQDTSIHFNTTLFSSLCVISNYLGNPHIRNDTTGAMYSSRIRVIVLHGGIVVHYHSQKWPRTQDSNFSLKMWKYDP